MNERSNINSGLFKLSTLALIVIQFLTIYFAFTGFILNLGNLSGMDSVIPDIPELSPDLIKLLIYAVAGAVLLINLMILFALIGKLIRAARGRYLPKGVFYLLLIFSGVGAFGVWSEVQSFTADILILIAMAILSLVCLFTATRLNSGLPKSTSHRGAGRPGDQRYDDLDGQTYDRGSASSNEAAPDNADHGYQYYNPAYQKGHQGGPKRQFPVENKIDPENYRR